MAHKTLIGGTAYEISGGKTLVNGTAYKIEKGKTLVGGTAYELGVMVTITINGGTDAFYSFAEVSIDGFKYGGKYAVGSNFITVCDNVQVTVPIGTEITCLLRAHYGDVASVKVNNNTVYSFKGESMSTFDGGSYKYTVVANANIDLINSDAKDSSIGGTITITEE